MAINAKSWLKRSKGEAKRKLYYYVLGEVEQMREDLVEDESRRDSEAESEESEPFEIAEFMDKYFRDINRIEQLTVPV